jgi:hypothetical protein
VLVVALGFSGAAWADCPTGQAVSADTAGHCCWPAQAWSTSRDDCVGIPACPDGFEAHGESCTPKSNCPAGQQMSEDTRGHCCWPAQVWSTTRGTCVGIPQCPTGLQVSGEICVAPRAPANLPPPASTQPPPQQQPANPSLPRWTPVNPSGGPSPAPTTTYQPVVPGTPAPPTYAPVLPAAPAPHVPVRFVARDHADDRYRISADGKSCTTPCTLELPSGELRVQADSGGRSLAAPLAVPGVASNVEVSHRSRGHYAVGGALLAVGLADMGLGFWFALGNGFDGHEAVGGVNIALGGIGAIIGIVDLAIAGRAQLELRAAEATPTATPLSASAR